MVENYFNFTDDTNEWNGTEIHFDVAGHGRRRRRSASGIWASSPTYQCFDVCSSSWDFYLHTSLRGLIRTGQGSPIP